jgi:glycosyltransferase involved in cell wall biosynthesis
MKTLSIIIATFNASEALERTLTSIFHQSFTDYEVIVIDGRSTDTTMDIVKENDSKIGYWISEDDNGIYDAMNKGIDAAGGKYIQFLNAGDCFVDAGVLGDVFKDNEEAPTLIYGDINMIGMDGSPKTIRAREFSKSQLLSFGTGVLCHQAMFVRRDSAPLYNTRYKFKGELNWYFDLVELDDFCYARCHRPIVNYELGGWGYQHFLRNRFDWVRLVYERYGVKTILDSRLLPYLWKNSFFRYPWLRKVHSTLTFPKKLLRKVIRSRE